MAWPVSSGDWDVGSDFSRVLASTGLVLVSVN